ncbi:MAG: hypothetical protein JSW28_05105 [Thermoplasmata archaeon]|nr:MAG: hypothetical protein JSW28_05105 [Thermoplasmata archaeon]
MKNHHYRAYISYFAFVTVLCLGITSLPAASADGADAELHEIDVSASPSVQGIGGEIIVDAAVYFFGGCCYHLYAFDVTANLSAPEEVTVITGPAPELYEEVDAQPGGVPTIVHFEWRVLCESKGIFNLTVDVYTENCGSMAEVITIEIVEGCSISSPEIYPEKPLVGRENIILISATNSLEGRFVEGVTLFYTENEAAVDGNPENDTIRLADGGEIKGRALTMEQDEFTSEQWTARLRTQNSGTLHFWIVAEDNLGENSTSSLFSMEVVDQEAVDAMIAGLYIGLILGTVIGSLLMVLIQNIFIKKGRRAAGVLATAKEGELEGDKKKGDIQVIIGIVLIISAVCIVLLGAVFGMFGDIVDLVT